MCWERELIGLEKIKIVIATNNVNKVREIESILGHDKFEFFTLNEIGFYRDIIEDGNSYIENAMIKAKEVYNFINDCWVIADDSGLEVPYLNNEPGVHSARYATDHDDKKNIHKLLYNMRDVEDIYRRGRFVCAIACIIDDNTCLTAEGEVWGTVINEMRGEEGFGYDPIMHYSPMNKTFGEMTFSEKNAISHRANALKKIKNKIESYLEENK